MIYLAVLAGIAVLIVFCRWQNNGIVVTFIDYSENKVPQELDGYTILHISDLHNKAFGEGQKKIVEIIARIHPDIIAVTGDIIDKRRTGTGPALLLAGQAVHIAPVYYVPGNHEKQSGEYERISGRLKACGVSVIANDSAQIKKNGAAFTLIGVKDREFYKNKKDYTRRLASLAKDHPNGFRLLLSHRPEMMEIYAKLGFDLVLTGHAHGGQWRLPLIGGLFAPHQGIFPKYTSGLYKKRATGMVVSRGLGNSGFPLRLFNRPELVVITLKRG